MYSLVGDVFTVDGFENDGGKEEEDGEELDGQLEEGEELGQIALVQTGLPSEMVFRGGGGLNGTYHESIQSSGCQYLILSDPVQRRYPSEESIRESRQCDGGW